MHAASRQSPSRPDLLTQPRPFGFGEDFALVDRDGVGRVSQVIAGVIDDVFRREVSDVLKRDLFEEFCLQYARNESTAKWRPGRP
jgi:hypothetical protein